MLANFSFQPRVTRPSGFTIIELFVAVSITVVMVGLILTIVTNVLTVWNRTSGDISRENQARQALDLLARDLQGAVFRADGNVWLAATVQSAGGNVGMTGESWTAGGGTLKPTGAVSLRLGPAIVPPVNDEGKDAPELGFEDSRFGRRGMWLRLFTVEPEANQPSAPRAVSYQIARREVGSGYTYQLFRSSVSPENTFRTGYDLFMHLGTNSYNSQNTLNDDPENQRRSETIRRPFPDFLLANDVIDFGVRFFDSDGIVLFPKTDEDFGLAATSATADRTELPRIEGTLQPPEGTGGRPLQFGFPAVAEIFLRIFTPEGARQIQALELGEIAPPSGLSADLYWWEIVRDNSQVYTRLVVIASRPL